MISLQKLRREWKTFALAIVVTVVGWYDLIVSVAQTYGYDYTQLIKAEYRMYVVPAIGLAFLALRKWKDSVTTVVTETVTETKTATEVPEDTSGTDK